MTALEIRLIAYGLLAFILISSAGWLGYHLTKTYYVGEIAEDQAAQEKALLSAQQATIAAQQAQKTAEQATETEHELRTTADTVSRAAVLSSVRGLEASVSRRLLPPAVANPGTVPTTQPGQSDPATLAGLVAGFNDSLNAFITACQNDSNDRTAIFSLEPKVN